MSASMATSSVIARIFFNQSFLFNLEYLSQCIHTNQQYNVQLIESLIIVFPFSLPLIYLFDNLFTQTSYKQNEANTCSSLKEKGLVRKQFMMLTTMTTTMSLLDILINFDFILKLGSLP